MSFWDFPTMASGIAVFVSIRFHGEAIPALVEVLERKVEQEGGCAIDAPEETDFAATFPRVTTALTFVRQAHEALARSKQQNSLTTEISVGIECGEQPDVPVRRIHALDRSAELAYLANSGQNVLGPAAWQIARPLLPTGFRLVELGLLRFTNSISLDRIYQLSTLGFPEEFSPIDAIEEVPTNVNAPTFEFIGREAECLRLRKLLWESQLVTIVGAAGVGKSALAHWMAYDLAEAYRDGTWKVDLAKIPARGNVASAMVADLKLPAQLNQSAEDRVLIALSTMEGLVWLDNCEHVLQEVRALLPKILKCSSKVRFLVTSHMPLRLDEEVFLDLHTFSIPDNPEDLADSEAIRLFISRVKKKDPDFICSPSDLLVIAEICRRVDGLPLAIELAAAQLNKQSVSALRDQLSDAMQKPLEDGQRHRTLERALSWSYSLLGEKEQRFFRYLGALAGPTNRVLAIAVGLGGRGDSVKGGAILDSLVAASLVQVINPKGPLSYRLLEPIRDFAVRQLIRKEEERDARTKFATACLNWLTSPRDARMTNERWATVVDRDRANLESCLEWLLRDPKGSRSALSMCVALYDYWILKGPYDGAHSWYQKSLAGANSTPAADTADIYNWLGTFAGYAGQYDAAIEAFHTAIKQHEKSGNRARQAVAYANLAIFLRNSDRPEAAIDASRKSIELSLPDDPDYAMRLGNLAFFLADAGHVEEAREWLSKGITANQPQDLPWPRACQESQLADLALLDNKTGDAEMHNSRSLDSYRECGNLQGLLAQLEMAGFIALRLGNLERAAKIIGGSDKHFLNAGVGRPSKDELRKLEALSAIFEALGQEQAEALIFMGALMNLDELYDYARSGSRK
jgi:predicted ATPase